MSLNHVDFGRVDGSERCRESRYGRREGGLYRLVSVRVEE
jgi:hypothetical protein